MASGTDKYDSGTIFTFHTTAIFLKYFRRSKHRKSLNLKLCISHVLRVTSPQLLYQVES